MPGVSCTEVRISADLGTTFVQESLPGFDGHRKERDGYHPVLPL